MSGKTFTHGHKIGETFWCRLADCYTLVAEDGSLVRNAPPPPYSDVPEYDDYQLRAIEEGKAERRAMEERQRAFDERPKAPPGPLRTDAAGFTWEEPREKLDVWDPTPDLTGAAIVAKVAALRAMPDDLDPADPRAAMDFSMPARVHSPRHDGWVPERQEAFLEQLAGTSRVTEAARFVEMSRQSARRLYNRDPQFRRRWHAALRRAKVVLLETAFERATHGTQVPVWNKDGNLVGYRERHHDGLLIALLQLCGRGHPGLADQDGDHEDEEGIGGIVGGGNAPALPWPIPKK